MPIIIKSKYFTKYESWFFSRPEFKKLKFRDENRIPRVNLQKIKIKREKNIKLLGRKIGTK